MKSVINKNLLAFIEDSIVLAQMFIVILFFECYSIRFEKQSLFNLKIGLETIQIKPFFSFLYFLVIARIVWLLIFLTKFLFHRFFTDLDIKVSSKVSFISFLLLILCSYYLFLLDKDLSLSPFYAEDISIYLNRLYFAPFLTTILITFIVTFFANAEFNNS